MHAHDALRALRAVGVNAEVIGPRRLRVEEEEWTIFTPRNAPTRADAVRALAVIEPGQRAVLFADRLTASLSQIALDDDRLVVVGRKTVIRGRQMMSVDNESPSVPTRPTPRRPNARFAVARALLSVVGSTTQQQIVERAGVTQGAASKALATSLFDGVLERQWGSIKVSDPGTLFDRVISEYPGPGGVATYWWSEGPIVQQAESVATADETALLSGDVAADAISAWRRPEHAVVYTRAEPDLRRLGFSLADPDDYTLMLIYPDDHTLWSTASAWSNPRMADPLIASSDVVRTGTYGDHIEAVDRLRNYVIGERR